MEAHRSYHAKTSNIIITVRRLVGGGGVLGIDAGTDEGWMMMHGHDEDSTGGIFY